MSYLKPGTLCITLQRRDPRNAGRIVRILEYVGDIPPDIVDGYMIEAENGLPFATTIWRDADGREEIRHGQVTRCRTSRAYLRPLVDPDLDVESAVGSGTPVPQALPEPADVQEREFEPEVVG